MADGTYGHRATQRARKRRYRRRNGTACMVAGMNSLDRRPVLVTAGRLDDALELSRLAADALQSTNPALADALRGAAAAVRAESVLEQ